MGRREVARAECLGAFAGGVDAGVLPRRPGSGAGLELGDCSGRGVGVDRTARPVRQVAVRAGLRAGDRLRRDGFLVSPTVAAQWAGQVPELRSQPGFAEAFLPGGRAPAPGERFRLPEHAATLETIAATGGEAFYRGELAATMEAHSTANGGVMLASDFAAHRADWVDPISIDYRGYTLHEIPPNGQGIIALIALGILAHFDMASLPVDSADSVHLQIEAIKLAFADALAYVADIDYMPVRPQQLLDADTSGNGRR